MMALDIPDFFVSDVKLNESLHCYNLYTALKTKIKQLQRLLFIAENIVGILSC